MSAIAVTEKQFLQQVKDLARILGWRTYHPWTSIHSDRGWPDVVCVRDERMVVAELKRDGAKPTPAQVEWLQALARVRVVEVHLWTPASWDAIVLTLQSDRG